MRKKVKTMENQLHLAEIEKQEMREVFETQLHLTEIEKQKIQNLLESQFNIEQQETKELIKNMVAKNLNTRKMKV